MNGIVRQARQCEMTPKKLQSGQPSLQNIEKYCLWAFWPLFLHQVNVIGGLVDHDVDEIEQANA